jgi:hypothetical protein
MAATGLNVGDRVRIHPASDWFMRGIVWVTITRVEPWPSTVVTVHSELFNKTFRINRELVIPE